MPTELDASVRNRTAQQPASLFVDQREPVADAAVKEYDDPELGHVIELPDTLDGRIDQFVFRWIRAEVREPVTQELRELIDFARQQKEVAA